YPSDTEPFIGDAVLVADAEREGRIVVEEEGGGVVVEAEEEHVGLLLRQPLRHRLVALEERLPVRVVLLALVERHRDRGHVRRADAADDACHAAILLRRMAVATRGSQPPSRPFPPAGP